MFRRLRDAVPENLLHVTTRYGRDLLMAGAGVILIGNAAPSIANFGSGPLFPVAWASFIAIGSTVSAVAAYLRRDGIEVIAQLWVGLGFLVWAISAALQPDRTAISWALALVFASVATGCVYRVEMIADRRVSR